ncbi:MAG: DUF11 domain-containing protein [Bacteroidetes bacterium]|nr:DUF11 domain-containing protein [Bacteroidota bacterium]
MIRNFIKSIKKLKETAYTSKVTLAILGVAALSFATPNVNAQVDITSTVPISTDPLDVCAEAKNFTVTFECIDSTTSNSVTLNLPTDVVYVPGSASGTAFVSEGNISNPSAPVINLVDMNPGDIVTLSFQARAYCGRINSAIQENNYEFSGSGGSTGNLSDQYNVRYAALTIVSISNQSYSGLPGSTFTRTVTVRNGGFGKVPEIRIDEVNDNGLQVVAVSGVQGSTALPFVNGTFIINDFTSIGNGNNYLDGNEQISFTETVKLPGTFQFCGGGSSGSNQTDYNAYYGCNGNNQCPVTNSTDISDQDIAGASWANTTPSFNIGFTYTFTKPAIPACASQPFQHSITYTNSGTDTAFNTQVTIYAPSWNAGGGGLSYVNNFTVDGSSVTHTVIAAPSFFYGTVASGGATRALVDIGTLAPGQSKTIAFDLIRACQPNMCVVNNDYYYDYYAEIVGFNTCGGSSSYNGTGWIGYDATAPTYDYSTYYFNSDPSFNLFARPGQKDTFCLNDLVIFPPQMDNTGYAEFVFTIPDNLNYIPGDYISYKLGNGFDYPMAAGFPLLSGNTLTLRYNVADGAGNFPVNAFDNYADICITLTGSTDPTKCGTGGNVQMKTVVTPSAACSCSFAYGCYGGDPNGPAYWYIELECPYGVLANNPCEGLNGLDVDIYRITIGYQDANNDQIADNTSLADPSLINKKMGLSCDVFQLKYTGVVYNPNAATNWNQGFLQINGIGSANTFGPEWQTITASIYDASTGSYINCNLTANLHQFTSTIDLSACGHNFDQGDSITILANFKLASQNVSWSDNRVYVQGKVGPDPYSATEPSPSNNFGCMILYDYFRTRAITWQTTVNVSQTPSGCGSGIVDFTLYGGHHGNFATFPNEVRNIISPTVWTIGLPNGAQLDSAELYVYSPYYGWKNYGSINPASYSSGLVTYDWTSKLGINGGPIPLEEQSNNYYWYTVKIYYRNGCDPVNQYNLPWTAEFDNEPTFDCKLASETRPGLWNAENFQTGSALAITTATPTVNANGKNVYWLVNLYNQSSSTIVAPWLAEKPGVNGITINKVWEYPCNGDTAIHFADYTPVNGMFQLSSIPANTTKCVVVCATITGCKRDSITVMSGYDCSGLYPTNISDLSNLCNLNFQELKEVPTKAQLQLIITDKPDPADTLDLCEEFGYEIAIRSAQVGTIYQPYAQFIMSPLIGVVIVSGTSQLEYPSGSGNWVTIADPTKIGNSFYWYVYNEPSVASTIGANGLPGILSFPMNEFKVRFRAKTTPCDIKNRSKFLFDANGKKACGSKASATNQITSPIYIKGAPSGVNNYIVNISVDSANSCSVNSVPVRISIKNNVPRKTKAAEYIDFVVFDGATLTSVTPVRNSPNPPTVIPDTGGTVYRFPMKAGILVKDSMVFIANMTLNPLLACDVFEVPLEVSVNQNFNAVCIDNGQVCLIANILGSDEDAIYINRPIIDLLDITATAQSNAPTGEKLHVIINMQNTGTLPFSTSSPFNINFYNDADLSGSVTLGDVFFSTVSVAANIGANGGLYTLDTMLNVPAGLACPLLAVIEEAPCLCSPALVGTSDVPLLPSILDPTVTCPGVTTVPLGEPAINGYTYQWTAVTPGALAFLSATNIANPTFLKTNNSSGSVETYVYNVVVTRSPGGCTAEQTVTVNLNPNTLCLLGSLGNYVWYDDNANGNQDEPAANGINGVTVYLYSSTDNIVGNGDDVLIDSTVTANNGAQPGYYLFDQLTSGNYFVVFPTTVPNSTGLTGVVNQAPQVDGNNDANASGQSGMVTINVNNPGLDKDNPTIDAGYVPVADVFDLALRKTTSQTSPVNIGDNVQFRIAVFNQGNVEAYNVQISDYIPAGFTFNQGASTGWTPVNASLATFNILGPILPGDSQVVLITLTVNATAAAGGSLTNRAEISAADNDLNNGNTPPTDVDSQPDQTPGNDTEVDNEINNGGGDEDDADPASVTFNFVYDLALTKVVNGGPFAPGENATFTITVYNQGNVTGTNINLVDYVPAGLTLNDPDWSMSGANAVLNTPIASLAGGSSTSRDITFTIDSNYATLQIVNYAEISSSTNSMSLPDIDSPEDTIQGNDAGGLPDGASDNSTNGDGSGNPLDDNAATDEDNQDPAVIEVDQIFDLALTKKLVGGPLFNAGSNVTFNIMVYNQGIVNATNIQISDYIPNGLTLDDANWTNNGGIATLNSPIASLLKGDSTQVSISFKINVSYTGTQIINVAEISSSDNALGLDDIDSPEDNNNANDAGGQPNSPADNETGGDGTGAPGDGNAATDEDNSDPALILVLPCDLSASISSSTNIACNGGSEGSATAVPANGTSPYSYVWSNGNTTDMITGLVAGIYTITITDFYGCTATATVQITQPAPVVVSCAGSDPTAVNVTDGYAMVNATGGTPPYTYLWSNGSTDTIATGLGSGVYTVTVTDANGCFDTCHVTLNEAQSFDLALKKEISSAGPFGRGSNVTFAITVYNQGNVEGTNIQVSDYIPAGMTLNDANWTESGGIATLNSTIASLMPATSTVVNITLQIDANFNGSQLVNYAEISSSDNIYSLDDIDSPEDQDNTNDAGGQPDSGADNYVDGNGTGTPGDGVDSTDEDNHDPALVNVDNFDLALTKVVSSSAPYIPGSDVTFTITVTNQGTLEGTNIQITDYIPTGMSLNDADWTVAGSIATLNTPIASLASGSSTTVDITLAIDANYTGTTLVNYAEISGSDNVLNLDDFDSPEDQDNTNDAGGSPGTAADNYVDGDGSGTPGDGVDATDEDNHDPALINITPAGTFDLALTKIVSSPAPYFPGNAVTFTITVYNQGTVDASNVYVTDYFPSDMYVNDANWTDNGNSTATLASPIASLLAGDSAVLTIDLVIDPLFFGTSLVNYAEISAATSANGQPDIDSDPDQDNTNDAGGQPNSPADNTTGGDGTGTPGDGNATTDEDDHDPALIPVSEKVFDLALRKKLSSAGPFSPGSDVTFTIQLFNQGNIEGTNIQVTDYIPTGMSLNDANWTATFNKATLNTTVASLMPGDSTEVTITLQINANFTGTQLVNYAEISSADNSEGLDDNDSPMDQDNADAGGAPGTEADDFIDGDGFGFVGDSIAANDEDNHDPAFVTVTQIVLGSLGNYLWYDDNQNGLQDEPASNGINGLTVYLYDGSGNLLDSTVTANDVNGNPGYYLFDSLQSGTYYVQFPLNAPNAIGLTGVVDQAPQVDGNNDANAIGQSGIVTINTALTGLDVNNPTIDAGYVPQIFDLALRKTTAQVTPVNIGDDVVFTITVFNQGNVAAYDVDVLDAIPAGFTFNAGASPLWTASGADAVANIAGPLAAGDSIALDITLTVAAGASSSNMTNIAEITSADNDTDSTNTPPTDVDSQPDTDPNNDTTVDDEINNGGGDEDDNDPATVPLANVLGSLGNYLWYDDNQNGLQDEPASNGINGLTVYLYDGSGNLLDSTVTANDVNGNPGYYLFDSLQSGTYYVQFPLNAPNAIGLTGVVDQAPQVDGNNDANAIGQSGIVTINTALTGLDVNNPTIDAGYVPQIFDLALRKTTAQVTPVNIGDDVVFTITVFNQGNVAAYDVDVLDAIPAGFTFNAGASPLWTASGADAVANIAGPLAAGDSIALDITLTVAAGASSSNMTNIAEITSADNDTDSTNTPPTDVDSQPDTDPNNDTTVDDEINNGGGDEDDNDPATVPLANVLGSLGNYLWYDDNQNGLQDEPASNGINGLTVYLYDGSGNLLDSTVTANDVNGNPGYYIR